MKLITKVVLIFFTCLFLLGCKKDACDNTTPVIAYKDFLQYGKDSAFLVIGFKDCDGDIGLSPSKTKAPYDYNMFLSFYEKRKGVWTKLDLDPPFYYRIPVLESDNAEKILEGDISVNLGSFYYNAFSSYDTFMYEVSIKDRALHESNLVYTEELYRPK